MVPVFSSPRRALKNKFLSFDVRMSANPLIITIPTWDRPGLLEKCLRSVFEDQKVVPNVIVSDNSTRDHIDIRKLRSNYPFTYVRQSGQLSVTEHHNACLKLPSTRWLWLVHDDDELYPESIAEVQSFLAECGDVGIVLGGVEYIARKQNAWKVNS